MTMFEKLCSERTIMNAWKQVKTKGSTGGVDGISLSVIENNQQHQGNSRYLKSW
jgi:hypothetical protein